MDENKRPFEDRETIPFAGREGESTPSASLIGKIGPYRLLRKLGEGGMGVVYLAEQENPKRQVALKVIRGGSLVADQQVKMFQREAQSLARLKHPNVAAIYESGHTEDGQHFFAMEYVHGVTLNEFLHDRKSDCTDPDELRLRLGMFRKIADAVDYAHQHGVIHRDLKPMNILVTKETSESQTAAPEVKILDFGLARITDSDVQASAMTDVGAIKGTLAYMSPEQTRGIPDEIDSRCDVYALGVVLYEMLTGAMPYDISDTPLPEVMWIINNEEPRPIKATFAGRRGIDADVETICLKALEKEPERRYDTATEMANDIGRYLASKPIMARPPSTVYQLKKFAVRNKLVVGFVAGFVVVALGFASFMTIMYRRANREAVAARTVATFLVGMFEATNPFYGLSRGREEELTAREVLDSSVARLDETLTDQPAIRAQLQVALGSVYEDLGGYDQAEPLLLDALEYYRADPGNNRAELAGVLRGLASLLNMVSRPDEAEPFARESVALYRKLGDDPVSLASSLQELAHPSYARGDYEEAGPIYREALALRRQTLGSDHIDTAYSLMTFGYMLFLVGQVGEGEEALEEAIAILRQYENGMHPWLATALNNAAVIYRSSGREEERLAATREAADLAQRTMGLEHSETQVYRYNLGLALLERGQVEESEELLRFALEWRLEAFGPKSTRLVGPMLGLARVRQANGEFEVAEQAFEEVIALAVELVGQEHLTVGFCRQRYASMLHESARPKKAEQQYLEALVVFDGVVGAEHVVAIQARSDLGHVLVDLERLEEAEALVQAAIDYYSLEFPEGAWQMTYAECILAGIASGRGQYADAERVLLDGLVLIEAKRGRGSTEWRLIELRLVALYQAWEKPEQAQQHLSVY